MTDTYYAHEDEVRDTPQTALENWGATLHTLANVAPEIAESVNGIGEQLGELYAVAEQSGDTLAMERLSYSWGHIQQVATKAVMLDGGIQAAKEVIRVVEEERQRLDAEYAELERAVMDVDTNDERVSELVDWVQQEMECDTADYLIEGVFDEMHYHIKRFTGIGDFMTIARFFDALQGEHPMDEKQIALLTELIGSFRKEG